MKISGAIFDMDGTLIDSMHIWDTQGEDFLRAHGFEPEPGTHDLFLAMGMNEFSAYVKTRYDIPLSIDEMRRDINKRVAKEYEMISSLKSGVCEYLGKLKKGGSRMCIATATDRTHVEKTLSRFGILHFFDEIFTCGEVGIPKTEPAIFDMAREFLGTPREETCVFEDSLFASETAKGAGYKVVGVYDRFSAHNEEKLRKISDVYIKSFEELL